MIQQAIAGLIRRQPLTMEEAEAVMSEIMDGEATPAQIAGFVVAMAAKGETMEEVAGCARAMRARATRVPTRRRPLVDTCGTGGDHSGTFNISTTAAFVVAAAGLPVAKHGNRSASSRCGSAEVLEALGVSLALEPELVGRAIDEVGIGFLYAAKLHGSMRHAAGPRKELGVRTIFNLLGPLTNPAGADCQLIGVATTDLVPLMAGALRLLGTQRALVVHGYGGVDELTLAGPARVAEVFQGEVHEYQLDPSDYGLTAAPNAALRGGEPAENAVITRAVLSGESGPRTDVVLFNAAAALLAGGLAQDLREGLELARRAIAHGEAADRLQALRAFAQSA